MLTIHEYFMWKLLNWHHLIPLEHTTGIYTRHICHLKDCTRVTRQAFARFSLGHACDDFVPSDQLYSLHMDLGILGPVRTNLTKYGFSSNEKINHTDFFTYSLISFCIYFKERCTTVLEYTQIPGYKRVHLTITASSLLTVNNLVPAS